jgi:hypothetical protein
MWLGFLIMDAGGVAQVPLNLEDDEWDTPAVAAAKAAVAVGVRFLTKQHLETAVSTLECHLVSPQCCPVDALCTPWPGGGRELTRVPPLPLFQPNISLFPSEPLAAEGEQQ